MTYLLHAAQGTFELVWSAAKALQPEGITQGSLYLAADRPAAEVKALVEGWMQQMQQQQQQPELQPAAWLAATVTVRQASSAVLHVLFHMPESAHRELGSVIQKMVAAGIQSTRCVDFGDDFDDLMALAAMKEMLLEVGLRPRDWQLSTTFLTKEVDVQLTKGA